MSRETGLSLWRLGARAAVLVLAGAAVQAHGATAGDAGPRSDVRRPYDASADAQADIAALLRDATDGRRILLVFGGNWCSDSRSLATRFADPDLAALLAREFRVLHVDVGRFRRNLDIAEKYGNPIDKGIPSVVVLSPAGEILYTDHGSLSSVGTMSTPAVSGFFSRLATERTAP